MTTRILFVTSCLRLFVRVISYMSTGPAFSRRGYRGRLVGASPTLSSTWWLGRWCRAVFPLPPVVLPHTPHHHTPIAVLHPLFSFFFFFSLLRVYSISLHRALCSSPARTSLTVCLSLRVTNHRRSVVLFVVLFLIDGANNSRMVWGLSSSHSCDRTVIRTTRCARQLGGSRVTVSRVNAFFCYMPLSCIRSLSVLLILRTQCAGL